MGREGPGTPLRQSQGPRQLGEPRVQLPAAGRGLPSGCHPSCLANYGSGTGRRWDGRMDTWHPPFLRSSSSTTWMDSSGSFPGRGLRRRSPTAGGREEKGGGAGGGTGDTGPPKDTLQAAVSEERAVLGLPHRHGGQPVPAAVGERQRAPGRELLLPRLPVGLQPAGLRSAAGPRPGPGGSAGAPGAPGPA